MLGLGPAELGIILLIVVFIFGGKRLASLGKDIGGGLRNFRDAFKEIGPKDDDE